MPVLLYRRDHRLLLASRRVLPEDGFESAWSMPEARNGSPAAAKIRRVAGAPSAGCAPRRALCCDDWVENTLPPPVWLRIAEAAGCGLVMAAGMAMVLIYLSDRLPFPTAGLHGWKIAMVIGFPTTIAMVFGGCVPHIYRAARRAANIRREEATQSVAHARSLTALTPERHSGREAADAPQPSKPEAGLHGRHPTVSRHAAPGSSAGARKTDCGQAPATTGQSRAAEIMTDDGITRR
jgi:hypothetical protein